MLKIPAAAPNVDNPPSKVVVKPIAAVNIETLFKLELSILLPAVTIAASSAVIAAFLG